MDELQAAYGNDQKTNNNSDLLNPPFSPLPYNNFPNYPLPTHLARRSLGEGGSLKFLILLIFLIILIIGITVLSYFFATRSRQPKTGSRASNITPSISFPSNPIISPHGFASLINKSSSKSASTKPVIKIPSQPHIIINITAKNNTFTPDKITAEFGQVITLILMAEDKNYDVSIPDFGIFKEISKGGKEIIEFQAQDIGEFDFFCTNACNNSPYARGTITIN